jgi:serine/threonine protein kinase
VERFRREAEAAAHLSHPNIVAVHDFAEEGASRYLVMEYIDGIDLSRLLAQSGPLPIPLACEFARQTALGLHHAHEQGFVHRDVKPQNLLVAARGMPRPGATLLERCTGGTVKILDMGLIRRRITPDDDPEMALTQVGTVIGTMDYLAPEQARNSHSVDHRADLYSLGCTLYHLLAGQTPFPGGTSVEKILLHQSSTPAPLSTLRPDLPSGLEKVVHDLLVKNPEERTASAALAALALSPFSGCDSDPTLLAVTATPAVEENVFAGLDTKRNLTDQAAKDTEMVITPLPKARTRRMSTVKGSQRSQWKWLVGGAVAGFLLVVVGGQLLSRPASEAKPPAKAKKGPSHTGPAERSDRSAGDDLSSPLPGR